MKPEIVKNFFPDGVSGFYENHSMIIARTGYRMIKNDKTIYTA